MLCNFQIAIIDMRKERKDILTAQHVEVGIVFDKMLSREDALAYFTRVGVPAHVIRRVLDDMTSRRPGDHEAGQCRQEE